MTSPGFPQARGATNACVVKTKTSVEPSAAVQAHRFADRRRKMRGSVMVEFALGSAMVLVILAGVLEFGYSFYIYNSLQSSVRDAARYASLRPYDLSSGQEWQTAVKNMALYGDPAADGSGAPMIPHLDLSQITVTSTPAGTVPEDVSVQIDGVTINTFFRQITLNGNPRATFRFMGRVVSP